MTLDFKKFPSYWKKKKPTKTKMELLVIKLQEVYILDEKKDNTLSIFSSDVPN